jgi:hypothetical protein
MAVTWLSGFEGRANALEQDPGTGNGLTFNGTTSFDTTTFRSGAAALRCNPASGASGYTQLSGGTKAFMHFGLRIATLPSLARVICGNSTGSTVKLNSDGTLEVFDGTTSRGSSSALSLNTWYWIGWRESAGTSVDVLQVDGVTAVNGTVAVAATSNIGFSGTEASAADIYIDDVIRDGAGFLASSKVDIALPISDNTVTGVTDANGATTNLWQAVDNTPPAGVASASEAANPKASIKYPASTTENYLANLETYTTLGIAAADTVLAVQTLVRHGEDIVTGTKNLQNVGALTNPTVAGVSVTAGSDGGAHGAEAGLWVTTFGTLTTSPSVTLGTSPTIRTSRVSEARVACLDFMGMNVAWTPAAAAERVPYVNPMPQFLAQ